MSMIAKGPKLILALGYVLSVFTSIGLSFWGIAEIPNRTSNVGIITAGDVFTIYGIIYGILALMGIYLALMFTILPIQKEYKVIGLRSGFLVLVPWLTLSIFCSLLLTAIYYDEYPDIIRYTYFGIISILQCSIFFQFLTLLRLKMPSKIHLALLAFPSSIQFSSLFISVLLLIIYPVIAWVPYMSIIFIIPILLSIIGLYQTTYTPTSIDEWQCVTLPMNHDGEMSFNKVTRIPVSKSKYPTKLSLDKSDFNANDIRIVQISDPHIGAMTSVNRLRTICEQTVQIDPDIIILTGDFYCVEGYSKDEDSLYNALLPLAEVSNKTFAILGNHDKEHCARELLSNTLQKLGIPLLVENAVDLQTDKGIVQVIGLDWAIPLDKFLKSRVTSVLQNIPRSPDAILRVVLLHDPTGFEYIPEDDKCVVFSGHTHGGQLGFLSLGINFTLLTLMSKIPDQGFFGLGRNRLYVHRAHGTRTILGTQVVRLGVTPEFSVVHIPT